MKSYPELTDTPRVGVVLVSMTQTVCGSHDAVTGTPNLDAPPLPNENLFLTCWLSLSRASKYHILLPYCVCPVQYTMCILHSMLFCSILDVYMYIHMLVLFLIDSVNVLYRYIYIYTYLYRCM